MQGAFSIALVPVVKLNVMDSRSLATMQILNMITVTLYASNLRFEGNTCVYFDLILICKCSFVETNDTRSLHHQFMTLCLI